MWTARQHHSLPRVLAMLPQRLPRLALSHQSVLHRGRGHWSWVMELVRALLRQPAWARRGLSAHRHHRCHGRSVPWSPWATAHPLRHQRHIEGCSLLLCGCYPRDLPPLTAAAPQIPPIRHQKLSRRCLARCAAHLLCCRHPHPVALLSPPPIHPTQFHRVVAVRASEPGAAQQRVAPGHRNHPSQHHPAAVRMQSLPRPLRRSQRQPIRL